MELLRMLSIWDNAPNHFESNQIMVGKGVSTVREVNGIYGNLFNVMTEKLSLEDVHTRFIEIKKAGNLRCRSLKLFFYGKMPDLSHKGLVEKNKIWILPHTQLGVCAVPYGKNEWCFMIEKRTGHGVPYQALNLIPYMDYQLQLEVDVG